MRKSRFTESQIVAILKEHCFPTLDAMREAAEIWRIRYNTLSPARIAQLPHAGRVCPQAREQVQPTTPQFEAA